MYRFYQWLSPLRVSSYYNKIGIKKIGKKGSGLCIYIIEIFNVDFLDESFNKSLSDYEVMGLKINIQASDRLSLLEYTDLLVVRIALSGSFLSQMYLT